MSAFPLHPAWLVGAARVAPRVVAALPKPADFLATLQQALGIPASVAEVDKGPMVGSLDSMRAQASAALTKLHGTIRSKLAEHGVRSTANVSVAWSRVGGVTVPAEQLHAEEVTRLVQSDASLRELIADVAAKITALRDLDASFAPLPSVFTTAAPFRDGQQHDPAVTFRITADGIEPRFS